MSLSQMSLSQTGASQTLTIAVVVSLSLYIAYVLAHATVSPLRNLPGPFWARYTRFWYLRQVIQGDFEKKNIELHAKYG
jgi:hypothetical protein